MNAGKRPDPRRRFIKKLGGFGVFAVSSGLSGLGSATSAARAADAGPGGNTLSALAATASAAPHTAPRRIVVMSWELTETLLALGIIPVGVSLPPWYRETIVVPALPSGVADIGLLYQPNFEVLLGLAPDLMIIMPGHAASKPLFERFAPTLTLGQYMSSSTPYEDLCKETLVLAGVVGRLPQAHALITETEGMRDTARAAIARLGADNDRPPAQVIVADMVDDKHLRVYGQGSLPDEMLRRLGVRNAANPGRPEARGWITNRAGNALISLQRLAEVPNASLLLLGPLPDALQEQLNRNAIWQALPAVQDKRVAVLPVISPYGGLISMQRFAHAVQAALTTIAANALAGGRRG